MTSSCDGEYPSLECRSSCPMRKRCQVSYYGRRAVLLLLVVSVVTAIMATWLALPSMTTAEPPIRIETRGVQNSDAIVQYRLDQIDAAIKELRKTDVELAASHADVSKWLLANLAAVIVALLVYIFTRPRGKG